MMYRITWLASFAVTIFLLLGSSFAQLKDQGSLSFGIGGGTLRGDTDFGRSNDYDAHLRGFIRFGITGPLSGELGGGLGKIRDSGLYGTKLYPVDTRLLFSPFRTEIFNIYAYAGIGALYYDSEKLPLKTTEGSSNSGWTGYVPAGLGLQLKLAGPAALEINGGYNHALDDKLDGLRVGKNDGFWNIVTGISFSGSSGNADPDRDGLSNNEEKQLGTDPHNPDTDGDGLKDGNEFLRYRTNPRLADSDKDGLSDYLEMTEYKTNPTKKDTDGDGLGDGEEINEFKTDPVKADTDDDGLNDADEVRQYDTDPLKKDTDGDGLSDGDEITTLKTNPLKTDSDGDGLSDGDEVTKYKTDPLKADTDGGTVDDSTEVARGTNPLNADDDVEKKQGNLLSAGIGVPITLEGIFFRVNSAEITPESEIILDKVYETLKAFPETEIAIRGYTDNTGNFDYNVMLSQKRAKSVRDYLVRKGINPLRITAEGFGPANPIASNATSQGRAKNRRIEFIRLK